MNSPLKCWCTNAAWSNSLFIILLTKFYIESLTEHKFYDMPLSIDISSCIIDWVQRLSIVVSSSLETGSIMFYQIESDLLAVSYDELWRRHLPGPRGQSSQTPDGAGYSQRHLHLTRGQASINLCPWPHKVRKDFLLLSCLTAHGLDSRCLATLMQLSFKSQVPNEAATMLGFWCGNEMSFIKIRKQRGISQI